MSMNVSYLFSLVSQSGCKSSNSFWLDKLFEKKFLFFFFDFLILQSACLRRAKITIFSLSNQIFFWLFFSRIEDSYCTYLLRTSPSMRVQKYYSFWAFQIFSVLFLKVFFNELIWRVLHTKVFFIAEDVSCGLYALWHIMNVLINHYCPSPDCNAKPCDARADFLLLIQCD